MRFHGEHLMIDDLQHEMLVTWFPEVDSYSEYRSIDAWLHTHRRRKGTRAFVNRWFENAKRREIARPEDEAIMDGALVRLTSADRRRNEWRNY